MDEERGRVVKARADSRPGSTLVVAIVVLATVWFVQFSKAKGQSSQDGKSLFENRCSGCHALDADHEGPRLRGVFGRPAGKVTTFMYSDALQKARFKWDETKLDQWLTDTESVAPNNDMGFRVPKPEERAAIVSYLKSLSPASRTRSAP